MAHPAPAAAPIASIAPAAPEPLTYMYSTGNASAAFAKFNGKNYFVWRRSMVTQLPTHGQWEVVDGSVVDQPIQLPRKSVTQTLGTSVQLTHTLQLDNDYGETIATISNPHQAWMMLESSYGSQQSAIQAVINAKLTLARWNGQTLVMAHRNHMKAV